MSGSSLRQKLILVSMCTTTAALLLACALFLVYDYATFRRVLIDPFRDGTQTSGATGFQLAAFDVARDSVIESQWVTAPRDAVLVVEDEPVDGVLGTLGR